MKPEHWAIADRCVGLAMTCPRLVRVDEPPGIMGGGGAYAAAHAKAVELGATEFIPFEDDAILCPNTFQLLMEDVEAHRHERIGFMACHSNNARLCPPEVVSPICAWTDLAAMSVTAWPNCNYFSDDLLCFDMRKAGFTHMISRGYVHHTGERSTGQGRRAGQLIEEGIAFCKATRPDFARYRGWL